MISIQPKLIATSIVFLVAIITPIILKTTNIEHCIDSRPFIWQFIISIIFAFGLLSIFIKLVKFVVRIVNSKNPRPGGDFPK